MSEQDRDQMISLLLIVLGIFVTIGAFNMPNQGGFSESPGLLPSIMGICLLFTAGLLFLRSRKNGGRLQLSKIGQMFQRLYTDADNRKMLIAIIFVGLYIFIGVTYVGYYISSAIFMVAMFLKYVKRFKLWISFLLASGLSVLLFLTFNKLFMLSIK